METSIQEAFKVLRANVVSEVLQLLDKFQDKSDLVSSEIGTLSAELDSVWMCHVASKSPLASSPTRDQVIVSQNQKNAQPGPRPINISLDEESSQSDASDSAALQRELHNRELSPEAVPPPPPCNEASCRRPPSPPDPMNIQHLLQAFHDILPDTPDVQSSAHGHTILQSSSPSTSQPQLGANVSLQNSPSDRDPRISTNSTSDQDDDRDINEEHPDTVPHASDGQELRLPSNASDQHSFHGNNSLEGRIASERQDGAVRLSSVAEHRRNSRRGEETEVGEREEEEEEEDERMEGDEQQLETREDGEEDENNDKDDNEHNEEPQRKLSGTKRTRETITSMQGKEKENAMRGKEKNATPSAKRGSPRKSTNKPKRTANGQELEDSPSKRPKTRALTPTTNVASLKSLEHIPKSSIQPAKVYKIFLDRSQTSGRRSIAEIRNLESYQTFLAEASHQRSAFAQARRRGENDSAKAHQEYISHIFTDRPLEDLNNAKEALKQDLRYGRRWLLFVDEFVDKKGEVSGLGFGALLLFGPSLKKKIYNHTKYSNPTLKSLVRTIHELHPHIGVICRILQPAAENLIYQHRLGEDDDLDTIVRDLGEYLKRDKRQRRGKTTSSATFSSLPANVEARSTPLHSDNSNMSTATLESEANVKLMHTFKTADSAVVTTSDSSALGSPSDQLRTVCENMMHPSYGFRTLTEEDFTSLDPGNDLTKGALDYLLSSLDRQGVDSDRSNFYIWPGISIHDPTGDDYTSTWSPRGLVKPFNNSRYQLLPYFCSHHWQLAVFDTENHNILRYDSFWPDGVDCFPFLVLERWLNESGGNPDSLAYRYDPIKEIPTPADVHDTGIITWWIAHQLLSGQGLDASMVDWTLVKRSAASLLDCVEVIQDPIKDMPRQYVSGAVTRYHEQSKRQLPTSPLGFNNKMNGSSPLGTVLP